MQLTDALLAVDTLANELSRTNVNLRAEMVADEELLDGKKTRMEGLERELATVVMKRLRLLFERYKTSQKANRPSAEDEGSV